MTKWTTNSKNTRIVLSFSDFFQTILAPSHRIGKTIEIALMLAVKMQEAK